MPSTNTLTKLVNRVPAFGVDELTLRNYEKAGDRGQRVIGDRYGFRLSAG